MSPTKTAPAKRETSKELIITFYLGAQASEDRYHPKAFGFILGGHRFTSVRGVEITQPLDISRGFVHFTKYRAR